MTQKKPRSAKTGKFVPEWVNDRWPDTHYVDTIKYPKHRTKTKKRA